MKPIQLPTAPTIAERVRRLLEHYGTQSDEEAVAEDEAAYESPTHTIMEVPVDLVPAIRELISRRESEQSHESKPDN